AFVFSQMKIMETNGGEFLTATSAVCKISPFPLLLGRVEIPEISFHDAKISILRYPNGSSSIADLLHGTGETPVKTITLHNATLKLIDKKYRATMEIGSAEVSLSNMGKGKRGRFRIHGFTAHESQRVFYTAGVVDIPDSPEGVLRADIDAFLAGVDLKHLHDLLDNDLPQWSNNLRVSGRGDFKGSFSGNNEEFSLRTEIKLHDLKVAYPPAFLQEIATKEATIAFSLKATPSALYLKNINIKTNGVVFQGAVTLEDIHSDDPYLFAEVASREFSFLAASPYIPYKIIPKPVTDFMREKIISIDSVVIEEARLEGRIKDIANITEEKNKDVLFVSAKIGGAAVAYWQDLPTFNRFTGMLELRGRDFSLKEAKGFFGDSPMVLEGRITNYNAPDLGNSYEFSLVTDAGSGEMSKLTQNFIQQQSGASQLLLNGSGPLEDYRLSGFWSATPIPCRIGTRIEKPAGMPGILSFVAKITEAGFEVEKFTCLLGNLSLAGFSDYANKTSSLHIQSNDIDIEQVASLHPRTSGVFSAGTLRVDLLTENILKADGFTPISGALFFTNLSTSMGVVRFSQTNGSIRFQPGEAPFLEAVGVKSGGGSQFRLVGKVDSFNEPLKARLQITVPQLLGRDFIGATTGNNTAVLTELNANLIVDDSTITIASLSAKHPNGDVVMRGQLQLPNGTDKSSHLSFNTNFIPTAALFSLLNVPEHFITGKIAVGGKVTFLPAGDSLTANGSLDIQAQDGVIVGFPSIHRVFGLLNMQNYLKMRLPDGDNEGMPFVRLSSRIYFDNKRVDLRRVEIKSDSVNLTIFGMVFLANNTIDLIVGVHPLQMVDAIVSGVPVFGWILTNDKKMLTLLFEVKGPFDDPKVIAMPIRSLTKGVFDVFVKTLLLPIKIFSDTGEILLGE
ncbi:MAG: AsmA-like C-terminal region-containing protein, partial [Deltaproteobacteria bacterium]|nr:AsmA-like C-terminal region-containing protein [Deltaproteobacteria bacterium]